jgi:hypothetical protein
LSFLAMASLYAVRARSGVRRPNQHFEVPKRDLRPKLLALVRLAFGGEPDRARHDRHLAVIPDVFQKIAVQMHQRQRIDA